MICNKNFSRIHYLKYFLRNSVHIEDKIEMKRFRLENTLNQTISNYYNVLNILLVLQC